MRTCGIDLGTTNSCIVVVEENNNRLIVDDQGNDTFPSVVHIGRDGRISVGHAARTRIGEQPGPIATIKRKMGSTDTVHVGGKSRTPVEVSAMILRFLKELAEKHIGETVDRAVVTVPAYFNHCQRQHTDDAARQAGFRDVVTLLEPVAAALAYSLDSQQETLRIFVYDLGGGTFDATVLEKDAFGGLTVLSFGGDPHLGGDDVDSRLASVILNRLRALGYRLEFDLSRPADFSRFQRLKFYAEVAKKQLTVEEECELVRSELFLDDEGNPVDLMMTITRSDLEDCCQDLIRRTIDASLATLSRESGSIPLTSIDEVIMVGGMSYMPLVQRMLGDAFGCVPKLVDPNLIVARGAACKAAEVFADQDVAASGLKLEVRYDRKTDQDRVRISGVFDRVLQRHTVFLTKGKDERFEELDATDRFAFEKVPVALDSENVFILSVEDHDENVVIQRELRIVHDSKVTPVLSSPGSVVTKPIAVWTLDGPHVLFPENTALPYTASYQFETADQSGRILAPILEGDQEVARLEVLGIPERQRVGTPVMIKVTIRADYRIEAEASIPEIERSVNIEFHIKPVDTSDITPEFVRRQLDELATKAADAAEKCPSPEAVKLFLLHVNLVRDQITAELNEPEPKRSRLREKLIELSSSIDRLPAKPADVELKPSLDEFGDRLQAIVQLAIESRHSRLGEVEPSLDSLRAQARNAWQAKDLMAWNRVNRNVDAIAAILRPEQSLEEEAESIAGALILHYVPQLRAASRGRSASDIDFIENEATRIFLMLQIHQIDGGRARDELLQLYRDRVVPLRQKCGLADEAAPVELDPAAIGTGLLARTKQS